MTSQKQRFVHNVFGVCGSPHYLSFSLSLSLFLSIYIYIYIYIPLLHFLSPCISFCLGHRFHNLEHQTTYIALWLSAIPIQLQRTPQNTAVCPVPRVENHGCHAARDLAMTHCLEGCTSRGREEMISPCFQDPKGIAAIVWDIWMDAYWT